MNLRLLPIDRECAFSHEEWDYRFLLRKTQNVSPSSMLTYRIAGGWLQMMPRAEVEAEWADRVWKRPMTQLRKLPGFAFATCMQFLEQLVGRPLPAVRSRPPQNRGLEPLEWRLRDGRNDRELLAGWILLAGRVYRGIDLPEVQEGLPPAAALLISQMQPEEYLARNRLGELGLSFETSNEEATHGVLAAGGRALFEGESFSLSAGGQERSFIKLQNPCYYGRF